MLDAYAVSVAVDDDREGIETQGVESPADDDRTAAQFVAEPASRQHSDLLLLARSDRFEGRETRPPVCAPADQGLHLADDERVAIEGDHVQLSLAPADVVIDNPPPQCFNVIAYRLFAAFADELSWISLRMIRHQVDHHGKSVAIQDSLATIQPGFCDVLRAEIEFAPTCRRIDDSVLIRYDHGASLSFVLAKATTYAIEGVTARCVTVEVDIRAGLPAFAVVGLPDTAVRESRERVRAAILNEGFEFPQRRVTVNLAPADLRKAGPGFDLAIALALLIASGQLENEAFESTALVGELSLDGAVQPVRGAIAIAEAAAVDGMKVLVVPRANSREAALACAEMVAPVRRLSDLVAVARGQWEAPPDGSNRRGESGAGPDLRDLRGHEFSQRALEIAAAGGHHVLFTGPPGCGKTMLARRLPSILPSMTQAEAVEVTRMQSIAGNLRVDGLAAVRPFRAPHHTISASGLTGGGVTPTPGEVTLATNGVLFLDELAEFSTRTLEALRQPLEEGSMTVTRGQRTHVFPAGFMLVAATNPCPCGNGGAACRCSSNEIARYQRRLSGPLLDRFDMHCRVERPTAAEVEAGPVTDSASVRGRVEAARARQAARLSEHGVHCNGQLDGPLTRRLLGPETSIKEMLGEAYRNNTLTLRGYDRCLRVARTIADLDEREAVTIDDVAESLAFRGLETR